MQNYTKHYIAGGWSESSGTEKIDVINASTEEVMGSVPAGCKDDVDRAVDAAAVAFPAWAGTPVEQRAERVQRIADGLKQHAELLTRTITGELGMPLKVSRRIQVGVPQMVTDNFLKMATEYKFENWVGHSLVAREPAGVVGCITPWNYPLNQIIYKIVPALLAGCTVVLKPSEVTPLNAMILAEIIEAAELPAGVFNLISGEGPVVGEAIASHPGVDMVSFTGSTRAGRRVAELAAPTVKRVSQELGGKSPALVLEDADLQSAVRGTVSNCFLNSGQTCIAHTRLLVPADRHDRAVQLAQESAEKFTVGDPFGESAKLGPLVSAAQRDRVRGYIQKGVDEGATLVTGGVEAPAGLNTGFYVQPTVFANVKSDMTIAQEEIFGPVLSILPYENPEQGVEMANDSIYGLAAAVWAGDDDTARRTARRIRAGQVDINGGRFNPSAPLGGVKQSGNGRELGIEGFEEFTEVKSMQFPF